MSLSFNKNGKFRKIQINLLLKIQQIIINSKASPMKTMIN